jgi:hypothetical protein
MEDIVVISAIKEDQKKPNHKLPLKPIDELKIKVDKIQLDVSSMKNDMRIIIDNINYQNQQNTKGYWF